MPQSQKSLLTALLTVLALASTAASAAAAKPAPLITAVGDIACSPGTPVTATTCHQANVANAMAKLKPDSVWLLGDIQYSRGRLAAFQESFGPAFEKLKPQWRPTPGNHEYYTAGATGYYDFFGKQAGPDRRGYYSFNLGKWHIVSLNSNCDVLDLCRADSPQGKWLKADLKRHPRLCTAAYWHHPLYSSGYEHGSNPITRPLWKILEKSRAEVVLTGHDHDFELFPRQDAYGNLNDAKGLEQFVVGTGGKSQYSWGKIEKHSKFRRGNVFGFLSMRLNAKSYNWRFINDEGKTLNRGSKRCR
jgi:3',5'-cyclic AMP phosphodiesterase CpdA